MLQVHGACRAFPANGERKRDDASTDGLENVQCEIATMRTPDGHCYIRGPEGIIVGLAEQLA